MLAAHGDHSLLPGPSASLARSRSRSRNGPAPRDRSRSRDGPRRAEHDELQEEIRKSQAELSREDDEELLEDTLKYLGRDACDNLHRALQESTWFKRFDVIHAARAAITAEDRRLEEEEQDRRGAASSAATVADAAALT